jgi:hypothetical protein
MLQQEMADWTGDAFESLYKSAIMIQGRNAELDNDISLITSHQAIKMDIKHPALQDARLAASSQ